MTAPERIWITPNEDYENMWARTIETDEFNEDGTEYLRADIAAAEIARLRAANLDAALQVIASDGQAQEALDRALRAEAEVERLRGLVLRLQRAVRSVTLDDVGPLPDDKIGVWLVAIKACQQAAENAARAAIGGEETP